MKKIILTSAIIFATVAGSFAQETADITLNVILTPFQTINVKGGQKTVNLKYNTAETYKEGVSKQFEDHLTIQSTGAFIVKVSSKTADNKLANNKTGAGSTETIKSIESTGIAIKASNGSAKLARSRFTKVDLTSLPLELISSEIGSLDATYHVEYTGEKNNGYLNKLIQNGGLFEETTYTTTVTYSLEAV